MPKKEKMLSKKQKSFLTAKLHRINLLYGSVRSGKTWISLLKWALWIGEQPKDKNFLMVGKTLTSLNRNCFPVLHSQIGNYFSYSMSKKTAYIFGRTVWLEGANDERAESKIRGMTLKGAYIDELTQIPESFYKTTLGRLSEPKSALIATTNPDSPNHYVKTEIIDNDIVDKKCHKFLLDDNITLDRFYKENIKKEYTGVYYDRYILGEFVRAEGIIFRDFADNAKPWIISVNEVPKNIMSCEVGFDIGGNGSAYALTCTAISWNGELFVLKSKKIQADKIRMEDIEKFVFDFCQYIEEKYKFDIESINCDHVAVIVNSLNDNLKYRAELTYKPPVEDRPYLYSKLLAVNKIHFVENECDDLIDELQNLVYDEKSEKAIPLDDGSMQIDAYDSLTYSIAGNWDYLDLD